MLFGDARVQRLVDFSRIPSCPSTLGKIAILFFVLFPIFAVCGMAQRRERFWGSPAAPLIAMLPLAGGAIAMLLATDNVVNGIVVVGTVSGPGMATAFDEVISLAFLASISSAIVATSSALIAWRRKSSAVAIALLTVLLLDAAVGVPAYIVMQRIVALSS